MSTRRTYVLVDGENLDATLGSSVLGRRPQPEERPRWQRLTDHLEDRWGQPATGLFFLNVSAGTLPLPFVQALLANGYRPVALTGDEGEKVVDIGIQRTLDALRDHDDADVVLASHDADFAAHLRTLVDDGRRVAVVGFREFTAGALQIEGVEHIDLEHDVGAFNSRLPRVRVIPLSEFDPEEFLG